MTVSQDLRLTVSQPRHFIFKLIIYILILLVILQSHDYSEKRGSLRRGATLSLANDADSPKPDLAWVNRTRLAFYKVCTPLSVRGFSGHKSHQKDRL